MQKPYKNFIKRILDIVCSVLALIILSPVLLITAILVKVKLGSPVIFKQSRPGKDEKIFNLYKFRTMTDERDEEGNLLPDSERLPKFGRTLRSTSLDELPELWNILRGDMSFVGPRPLLAQYLSLYNERQKRRHEVRPGLTGLAQINGRNAVNWEERFNYDARYVEEISFILDVKIIINTIFVVFNRDGVTSSTSVTMEPFKGNENE